MNRDLSLSLMISMEYSMESDSLIVHPFPKVTLVTMSVGRTVVFFLPFPLLRDSKILSLKFEKL